MRLIRGALSHPLPSSFTRLLPRPMLRIVDAHATDIRAT